MALTQKQIDQAILRDTARHGIIAQAWTRYEGEWPAPLLPVPSDPDADDNLIANLAKVAVDTSAFFLMGTGPEIEVDGDKETPGKKTPAGLWLDGFFEQNKMAEVLLDAGTSGDVSGDVFFMLHAPEPGDVYPSLTLLDPQHVSVITNPINCKKVDAFIISALAQDVTVDPTDHDAHGKTAYQQVIDKNDAGQWQITERAADPYTGKNVVQGAPVVWPYSWAPIFHCKNLPSPHSYFGTSGLSNDVQRANKALNFALSNTNRVQRLHGHPKPWAKGVASDETIDMAPDVVTIFDDADAELNQIAPASDVSGHLEYIRLLRELFHEISQCPEIASGKLNDVGQLSGLALKILYGPLLRLTKTKQTLYGPLLIEVCKRALEMGGQGEGHTITINWPVILPVDEKTEWEAAGLKNTLGVSKATILTERGYDAETEAVKRAKEAAQEPTPQPQPGPQTADKTTDKTGTGENV